MKITIKDVARMAQVSPSTVSRALQGNPRISEEVRQRVQRIAKEMDFHPNQMARSLVKGRSRIVGLLFPGGAASSMGHPFYPAVLRGLGQVAGERGYHMLLSTGNESLSDQDALRELVDSGYVSGLVLLAAQSTPLGERLPSASLPVVEIGHSRQGEQRYYVDTDNVQAGAFVTDYLLDRGHQRILFLGYSSRYCVTVDRRQGYESALEARNLPFRREWVVPSRFIENDTDTALLEDIFTQADRPTAVVSMDDPLSMGLISCLGAIGLRVPEDVSVISFNNTQAGQYTSPALTSVDVDPYRLGTSAMHLLLDVITGKIQAPAHTLVPFQLMERDSVASLAKGGRA